MASKSGQIEVVKADLVQKLQKLEGIIKTLQESEASFKKTMKPTKRGKISQEDQRVLDKFQRLQERIANLQAGTVALRQQIKTIQETSSKPPAKTEEQIVAEMRERAAAKKTTSGQAPVNPLAAPVAAAASAAAAPAAVSVAAPAPGLAPASASAAPAAVSPAPAAVSAAPAAVSASAPASAAAAAAPASAAPPSPPLPSAPPAEEEMQPAGPAAASTAASTAAAPTQVEGPCAGQEGLTINSYLDGTKKPIFLSNAGITEYKESREKQIEVMKERIKELEKTFEEELKAIRKLEADGSKPLISFTDDDELQLRGGAIDPELADHLIAIKDEIIRVQNRIEDCCKGAKSSQKDRLKSKYQRELDALKQIYNNLRCGNYLSIFEDQYHTDRIDKECAEPSYMGVMSLNAFFRNYGINKCLSQPWSYERIERVVNIFIKLFNKKNKESPYRVFANMDVSSQETQDDLAQLCKHLTFRLRTLEQAMENNTRPESLAHKPRRLGPFPYYTKIYERIKKFLEHTKICEGEGHYNQSVPADELGPSERASAEAATGTPSVTPAGKKAQVGLQKLRRQQVVRGPSQLTTGQTPATAPKKPGSFLRSLFGRDESVPGAEEEEYPFNTGEGPIDPRNETALWEEPQTVPDSQLNLLTNYLFNAFSVFRPTTSPVAAAAAAAAPPATIADPGAGMFTLVRPVTAKPAANIRTIGLPAANVPETVQLPTEDLAPHVNYLFNVLGKPVPAPMPAPMAVAATAAPARNAGAMDNPFTTPLSNASAAFSASARLQAPDPVVAAQSASLASLVQTPSTAEQLLRAEPPVVQPYPAFMGSNLALAEAPAAAAQAPAAAAQAPAAAEGASSGSTAEHNAQLRAASRAAVAAAEAKMEEADEIRKKRGLFGNNNNATNVVIPTAAETAAKKAAAEAAAAAAAAAMPPYGAFTGPSLKLGDEQLIPQTSTPAASPAAVAPAPALAATPVTLPTSDLAPHVNYLFNTLKIDLTQAAPAAAAAATQQPANAGVVGAPSVSTMFPSLRGPQPSQFVIDPSKQATIPVDREFIAPTDVERARSLTLLNLPKDGSELILKKTDYTPITIKGDGYCLYRALILGFYMNRYIIDNRTYTDEQQNIVLVRWLNNIYNDIISNPGKYAELKNNLGIRLVDEIDEYDVNVREFKFTSAVGNLPQYRYWMKKHPTLHNVENMTGRTTKLYTSIINENEVVKTYFMDTLRLAINETGIAGVSESDTPTVETIRQGFRPIIYGDANLFARVFSKFVTDNYNVNVNIVIFTSEGSNYKAIINHAMCKDKCINIFLEYIDNNHYNLLLPVSSGLAATSSNTSSLPASESGASLPSLPSITSINGLAPTGTAGSATGVPVAVESPATEAPVPGGIPLPGLAAAAAAVAASSRKLAVSPTPVTLAPAAAPAPAAATQRSQSVVPGLNWDNRTLPPARGPTPLANPKTKPSTPKPVSNPVPAPAPAAAAPAAAPAVPNAYIRNLFPLGQPQTLEGLATLTRQETTAKRALDSYQQGIAEATRAASSIGAIRAPQQFPPLENNPDIRRLVESGAAGPLIPAKKRTIGNRFKGLFGFGKKNPNGGRRTLRRSKSQNAKKRTRKTRRRN